MCKWTVCVFVFGLLIQVSTANTTTIVIHELSGTDSALLGTNTTTMVCDYDYGKDTGVEIKWFYNDTVPIFLWVPNLTFPQPMGPFGNLLEVTNNTIHFKEMNRNLTGNYTCKVSSNEGEKSITEPLVAYQPAVSVEFFPEDVSETLICAAYELYPMPTITVTASYDSGSNETIFLKPASDDVMDETDDDFFNVTKTYNYDKKSLTGSATFTCNIFIPNTNYNETLTVTYTVQGDESTTTDYPDFTTTTESSINSTMINSTTINSTISTTHQANLAVVSNTPTLSLMMVLAALSWKF